MHMAFSLCGRGEMPSLPGCLSNKLAIMGTLDSSKQHIRFSDVFFSRGSTFCVCVCVCLSEIL